METLFKDPEHQAIIKDFLTKFAAQIDQQVRDTQQVIEFDLGYRLNPQGKTGLDRDALVRERRAQMRKDERVHSPPPLRREIVKEYTSPTSVTVYSRELVPPARKHSPDREWDGVFGH
jgi:hypothetical protein